MATSYGSSGIYYVEVSTTASVGYYSLYIYRYASNAIPIQSACTLSRKIGSGSYADVTTVTLNAVSPGTETQIYYNSSFSATAGAVYTFKLVVGNAITGNITFEIPITIPTARPANWAWWGTHTSGQNLNITASEWNAFTARIQQFLTYKGYSAYSFTAATSGGTMYASQYNQAAICIRTMLGTSYPAATTVGATISAAGLNNLGTYLNQIT
jgi:hypothetical protein